MNFSVVIPVRNRPALVERAVAGAFACGYPRELFEVIVVDNGSTDDTAHRAAAAGARVVREPQPNRCLARNRGAREAQHEWVAFLDSDCVPEAGWLQQLADRIAALNDPNLGAVAGRVLGAPAQNAVEHYFEYRHWFDQEKYLNPAAGTPGATQPRFTAPFALTANLCARRDVYLGLGGLDPGLPYPGEDADWCWRLAQAGYTLGYAREARVRHFHRGTPRGLYTQAFHWGRGQADLFAKWQPQWGARAWFEPNHWVWAAKGLLKIPYAQLCVRQPFLRKLPRYDFLANLGLALGRLAGGLANRKWVA